MSSSEQSLKGPYSGLLLTIEPTSQCHLEILVRRLALGDVPTERGQNECVLRGLVENEELIRPGRRSNPWPYARFDAVEHLLRPTAADRR